MHSTCPVIFLLIFILLFLVMQLWARKRTSPLLYFFGGLLLFNLGMASSGFGQNPFIGTVWDDEANSPEPAPGASLIVYFQGAALLASTDSNGVFRLPEAPSQLADSIEVRVLGYVENTISEYASGDTIFTSQLERALVEIIPMPIVPPAPPIDEIYQIKKVDILAIGFPDWYLDGFYNTSAGLSKEAIESVDNATLQPALNSLPGVKMDTRGNGGSRRLSIRGSLLRSPFGVRNIKAYWEDMPLSIPDGSVPMEIADAANLGSISVEKGPALASRSSLNGGALIFYGGLPDEAEPALRIESGIQAGSFGLLRNANSFSLANMKNRIFVSYVHQDYKGYREQEANRKDMINIRAEWRPKRFHTIYAYFWHYDGYWELPGAINDSIARETPTSAVPYSVAANASVDRVRTRVGITYKKRWRKDAHFLTTTLYGYQTGKVNPYGTSNFFNGYKDESGIGYGGRSEMRWRIRKEKSWIPYLVNLGAEYQADHNDQLEHALENGEKDSLKVDRRVNSLSGMVFANAHWTLFDDKLSFSPGLDLNLLNYGIVDHFEADPNDITGSRSFNPFLAPHFVAKYYPFRWLVLTGKADLGYSPPAFWEISNSNGTINTTLHPEKGRQLSLRGELRDEKGNFFLFFEGYSLRIRNTILPTTLSSGEIIYENKGGTRQNGLEGKLGYSKNPEWSSVVSLRSWVNFAWQPYRFDDGRDLPGVPLWTSAVGVNLKMKMGLYAFLNGRYFGKTAINDANTAYQDPYFVLDGKIGYQKAFEKWVDFELFLGINNTLDTQYTSFLQLNGFNGNFFNPAPARNYYGGMKVAFKIKRLKKN